MVEQEVLDCMNDIIKKVVKKESDRQHYLKNKEKIKQNSKEYQQNNPEKKARYAKTYQQSTKGMKSKRINKWKGRGVITDNWDAMYAHYIQTSFCDNCKIELSYDKHSTKTTKCLDHDHLITDRPNFRNILCHPCNVKRK